MHGEVATTAGLDFAASSGGCSGDRSTAGHWSKVSASIIHDSCTVEGLQGERLILDRRCQPDGCSIWRVQLVAWVPECAVQPALADDFRRQHGISGETSKRAPLFNRPALAYHNTAKLLRILLKSCTVNVKTVIRGGPRNVSTRA